jgi:alkanesulfonate monooxygenase SsuD/methylene tetrahydromethanopterin reductase-like flavin-dependent oxidoreductase (luciferase family)
MVREYVEAIRSVLQGAAGYEGQLFRTGMVPLDSRPVRADLPIYLGALGPRMLALAGRIADGFVAHGSAARLAEYRAAGVDLPVVFPMPVGSDWGYEQTIAELAR